MIELDIIKILIPWLVSFLFGLFSAPVILAYLYKYKVWPKNKNIREKLTIPDERNEILKVINKENTVNTPRMGGLVIVFSVVATTVLFWAVSFGIFGNPSGRIDFLSRSQTWLVLGSFLAGALLGFVDDIMTNKNIKIGRHHGFPWQLRIILVILFSLFVGWWFYSKLGYSQVMIPFYGYFEFGWLFIPFFMMVFLASFATSNIDGLDGLAGGIMATIFTTMGFIAYSQELLNISAFCFVVTGGILAFLWFNVSPARFYMSEIGYSALSFTLPIIAFMTDTVFLLPIIAFMLFINLCVTVIQRFSIVVFKKRVFRAAPLHHHFEILGWSTSQIVFRYLIISIIMAILGVALATVAI
ncbi:MAG: hypothetical protein KAI16_02230 [Candidatus Pacebacteria bacterium]|nr:hypothetical protein [Candidatus Paceibacterota bacterium]